jgi:hypothetical protein
VDYVVSCLIAHTAAGTLGPVNAGTGSVPFTTAQIIGDNFDLLPPAVWRKDITIADLKGFMSLYKVSQVARRLVFRFPRFGIYRVKVECAR